MAEYRQSPNLDTHGKPDRLPRHLHSYDIARQYARCGKDIVGAARGRAGRTSQCPILAPAIFRPPGHAERDKPNKAAPRHMCQSSAPGQRQVDEHDVQRDNQPGHRHKQHVLGHTVTIPSHQLGVTRITH